MKTARQLVYAALKSSPVLKDLPIRPGIGDGADKPPYLVYQQIYYAPARTLQGVPTLENYHYQVDVYAIDPDDADLLAKAAAAALLGNDSLGATFVNSASLYETAAKLHRVKLEFSLWICLSQI